MLGIDVSSHDNFDLRTGKYKVDTEECYQHSDFVIIKASEGTSYTNPAYKAQADRVIRSGKCLGFYHYARGYNAADEADYFWQKIKDYAGKALFALDFEQYINKAWSNRSWALEFVDAFHALSGVYPLIYVQVSAIDRVKNCADVCPLWVAGYPSNRATWDVPTYPYGSWYNVWGSSYTIWQFTSSNDRTDRNTTSLTPTQWQEMAKGDKVVAPQKEEKSAPDSLQVVVDDGIYWVEGGDLGYDQSDRDTWRDSGFKKHKEVDCSSFIIALLEKHGYNTGKATYTGNMRSELCKHGWVVVSNDGSPRLGDILLNDVHHTAMSCGDGTLIQASRGEAGHRISGGQPGDQDGKETVHTSYYDYPWDCYLRFMGSTVSSSANNKLVVDGYFGTNTIKALQRTLGTPVDGIVSDQYVGNKKYFPALTGTFIWRASVHTGSTMVKALQRKLGVEVDGFFGRITIKALQRKLGVDADGYFGKATCRALQRGLNRGEF